MFDWVSDAIDSIKEIFYDIVDFFVDMASQALQSIGLAQAWDDLLATGAIQTLLSYAPLADKLISWEIITAVTVAEMTILLGLVTFKVVVKMIPTIW
jgi:hypothetical protein